MKNLAYEQHGLDCHIGILCWPAARPGLRWAPLGNRLFGKPHRKVTASLERCVVRRPVRHLVMRLLEFVAMLFAVFVRHGTTWKEMMPDCTLLWRPVELFNNALNDASANETEPKIDGKLEKIVNCSVFP